MQTQTKKQMSTETLVMGAILTALVIILQFMGAFIRLGPFSISLVLVPIIIGAATCGKKIGAWLGFVFGIVVLASGDAASFLAVNVPGTIITVLFKGTACGFLSGLVYSFLEKHNKYFAVAIAAIVCPIVNTGIFLIGCFVFFFDTISMWATASGLGGGIVHYMIFGLVGLNFVVELGINLILSPIIVRLLNIRSIKRIDTKSKPVASNITSKKENNNEVSYQIKPFGTAKNNKKKNKRKAKRKTIKSHSKRK